MNDDVIPLHHEVPVTRRLEAAGKVRAHTRTPPAYAAEVEAALTRSVRVRLEVDVEGLLARLVESGVPPRVAIRIVEGVQLDDQIYVRP